MSLLVVDVSIYLHRAKYAEQYGGDPVESFWMTMRSLKNVSRCDNVIYSLDGTKPTFRHKMYSGYKAHRPEKTEEFKAFKDYIEAEIKRKYLYEFQDNFESDDILSSSSIQYPGRVVIGSNDLDMTQLVTKDRRVIQLKTASTKFDPDRPFNTGFEVIDTNYVISRYGVHPHQIPTWKSLAGDKSDGYKLPIRGLGDVAATKLLIVYKTLEGIFEALDDEEFILPKFREPLREHKQEALFFRELATTKKDLVLETFKQLGVYKS